MQKFNRGEWSEAYVLLKLLADGKMFAQDSDGNATQMLSKIESVIKIDKNQNVFEFQRTSNDVLCLKNGSQYKHIPLEKFKAISFICAEKIIHKEAKDSAFEIPEVEDFFKKELSIEEIKSDGVNKDDITLKIIDPTDGAPITQSFSIKSKMGSSATLFNFSKASNIVYSIKNCTENEKIKINGFLKSESKDIKSRIEYIKNSQKLSLSAENSRLIKGTYGDIKTEGNFFAWNLDILDYRILYVLAEMLLKVYSKESITDIQVLTKLISEENPLQIESIVKTPAVYDFYTMKMRQFLFAAFCGLTASKKWSGKQKVNGGYLEVQKDGSILYQKALSDESFTDYLIKNTKFDTPSSKEKKGDFGDVYFNYEYNKYCIDLNFQIRFK